MPRYARSISKSGVYHVMLRGINRQTIFEDEEDMQKLLDAIKKYKTTSKYEIYAYCIMNNHVHLLIKELGESISNVIKRVSSSYVFWYNKKYERCGHLFQERFKSEAIESDEYFLTVLRYIHQNPVKAGIVKDISSYKWSSYSEYIDKEEIVDIDFALDMFSTERESALELYKNFNRQKNSDMCLEDEEKVRASDNEVKEYIKRLNVMVPKELRQLEKSKRDEILKKLKSVNGITIRQLSRMTGISKSVIDRV